MPKARMLHRTCLKQPPRQILSQGIDVATLNAHMKQNNMDLIQPKYMCHLAGAIEKIQRCNEIPSASRTPIYASIR